jgi:hypothetical protein
LSAEWHSAAFDVSVAPFYQSRIEVRVEPSKGRVRLLRYGVHGSLHWGDVDLPLGAPSRRAAGLAGGMGRADGQGEMSLFLSSCELRSGSTEVDGGEVTSGDHSDASNNDAGSRRPRIDVRDPPCRPDVGCLASAPLRRLVSLDTVRETKGPGSVVARPEAAWTVADVATLAGAGALCAARSGTEL